MKSIQIGGIWNPKSPLDRAKFQFMHGDLCLRFEGDMTVCQDERIFFVADGQLFDVSIEIAMQDQERLDAAFGYFAYIRYDRSDGSVTIGTDRFGYFPMYYAFEDGSFIFGSSLGAVKSQLRYRSPDFEAWEELLVLGEVIGEKSTVKQIKRLSHGVRIQIKAGCISFVKYWSPEVPEPMDEKSYIKENNRLLEEAMALTASNTLRKVVLLSGGEDSRRLAQAAVNQGLPVDFFTQESAYRGNYKTEVDRDIKVASSVAALLGRQHFSEPMPSEADFLIDWSMRDSRLGFECIAHEWLLPLARRITPASLIYDGIVGDITMNGHYFKAFPEAVNSYRDLDAMANMICGEQRDDWLGELRHNTGSALAERVKALLSVYPNSPQRLNFYYILNHTRRKISAVSQLFRGYGHSTCYPFLYYPLFLQSLQIDPQSLVTQYYQRECMAAQFPDVLSVPTTRENISTEWLIPRADKSRVQSDYLLKHLRISDRALDIFPKFRVRYKALQAAGRFGAIPLRQFGWFIPTISRFSSFLDWLDTETD